MFLVISGVTEVDIYKCILTIWLIATKRGAQIKKKSVNELKHSHKSCFLTAKLSLAMFYIILIKNKLKNTRTLFWCPRVRLNNFTSLFIQKPGKNAGNQYYATGVEIQDLASGF